MVIRFFVLKHSKYIVRTNLLKYDLDFSIAGRLSVFPRTTFHYSYPSQLFNSSFQFYQSKFFFALYHEHTLQSTFIQLFIAFQHDYTLRCTLQRSHASLHFNKNLHQTLQTIALFFANDYNSSSNLTTITLFIALYHGHTLYYT